jgi:hypothetical protein
LWYVAYVGSVFEEVGDAVLLPGFTQEGFI